jgi:molybdate transport system ATP-binding protein
MSDFSTQAGAFLRFEIEQRLGDLELSAACELAAPWTVLFGPSGAGKTSLLRVLGGLSRPLSGRVILRDRTLTDIGRGIRIPAAERRIGFVTQQPALFPHMNVAANVGFGLHGLRRNARSERIAQMLDLFAAEHLANRAPASLSVGEKQRVALARALAPEPQLLLLDEPFTGLDATLKEAILGNLSSWLEQRKISALYVSHDIVEVFETAADVIVLRNGKVEAQGAATAVLAGERERLLQRLGAESPNRKVLHSAAVHSG